MARPPRRPVDPRDRRIAIIFIAVILAFSIVSFTIAFWPRDDEDEDTTPTATPSAPASPTADAAALGDDCRAGCPIRLANGDTMRLDVAAAAHGQTTVFATADRFPSGGSWQ